MMVPTRIRDCYPAGTLGISFEIFPPKTTEGDAALFETLARLAEFRPAFVSCTYGAGGTTRTRTVDLCQRIQAELNLTATAHFTCVGLTAAELREWLLLAAHSGIRNFMALRGDPPQGSAEFQRVEGGFRNAVELVRLIRGEFPEFGIGVAGYPEKHPEAADAETDLLHLRTKVAAGADAVYTQLFYFNDAFFRFRDRCAALGIGVPIIPGIMPITEFARIKRIAALCQSAIPAGLASQLEAVQDDKTAQFEIGTEYAIEQCRGLVQAGVPGIHFYVLNRSQSCERILDALGLTCRPPHEPEA